MKMIATAERIKTLRENFGLSQAELAGRLDITRSSVNAWEMGISVPSTQYIVELAQLLGCRPILFSAYRKRRPSPSMA